MSLMTLTTAITGNQDPNFYAGRADAYDDHQTGTPLDTLNTRAAYNAEHHNPMYAAGYYARVLEIRRETADINDLQADIAHTEHLGRAA
ncbi:hypothetical protein [Streptomyces sp. WAC08241]|uniref:hypothetical protein n=1 Tax=Streptomyces sp. WAC08241 TaxID=2487421 RepID=UPI000F79A9E2|nr:hypothetical protein [Streptomyces sp. WAC08241]RSS33781.1 hypothetical protein EF906_31095 [Streptomyces sp. WAC08241]